jgi:nitrogen fixation NifU-like protein
MSDLRELYQEVILDHNKHPRNFGEIEGSDRHAEGYNPLCGDRLTVYLNLEKDVITEVAFQGSGCAISKASASLMTDAVKGKTVAEARLLFDQFHAMITNNANENSESQIGKLAVLAGVRDYPMRVKCAILAWHALRAAVDENNQSVSTE